MSKRRWSNAIWPIQNWASAALGPVGNSRMDSANPRTLSVPEMVSAALARLEARQLAFVESLTRFADRRSAAAEQAIRKLGLDPGAMMRATRTAQGGPLERLSTRRDGSLDPRFARLGASLSRMDALERGLIGIPQFMPADISQISSGFGFRRDPFTGGAAMHKGLDFKGRVGAPIHAAAVGSGFVVCGDGFAAAYDAEAFADAALVRFDALPAPEPGQMAGRWRGTGLPTGHPLDGLLDLLGWYGKALKLPSVSHDERKAIAELSRREVAKSIALLVTLTFSKHFYLVSITSFYIFYLIHTFDLSVQTAQLYLFLFLGSVAAGTVTGSCSRSKGASTRERSV